MLGPENTNKIVDTNRGFLSKNVTASVICPINRLYLCYLVSLAQVWPWMLGCVDGRIASTCCFSWSSCVAAGFLKSMALPAWRPYQTSCFLCGLQSNLLQPFACMQKLPNPVSPVFDWLIGVRRCFQVCKCLFARGHRVPGCNQPASQHPQACQRQSDRTGQAG